jgi:hypothetical protein
MLYTELRGHWYEIIVLNIHVSKEDKTNNLKAIFYEELECGEWHLLGCYTVWHL